MSDTYVLVKEDLFKSLQLKGLVDSSADSEKVGSGSIEPNSTTKSSKTNSKCILPPGWTTFQKKYGHFTK